MHSKNYDSQYKCNLPQSFSETFGQKYLALEIKNSIKPSEQSRNTSKQYKLSKKQSNNQINKGIFSKKQCKNSEQEYFEFRPELYIKSNEDKLKNIDIINQKIEGIIQDITASCRMVAKNKSVVSSEIYEKQMHQKKLHIYKQESQQKISIQRNFEGEQIKTKKKIIRNQNEQLGKFSIKNSNKQENEVKKYYFFNDKINESYEVQKGSYEAQKGSNLLMQNNEIKNMNEKLRRIAQKIDDYESRMGYLNKMQQKMPLNEVIFNRIDYEHQKANTFSNIELVVHKKKYPFQTNQSLVHLSPNLSAINTPSKGQPCALLKAFSKQIELDRHFRHIKHMYAGFLDLDQDLSIGSDVKWINLQEQLFLENIQLTISEVRYIFQPKEDEIDPFASVSHCHEELIHQLITAFKQSEEHWRNNVKNRFSRSDLKECNFVAGNIDRELKGWIRCEDLVVYLNAQLEEEYRTRDVLLCYNRFRNQNSYRISLNGFDNHIQFRHVLQCLLKNS